VEIKYNPKDKSREIRRCSVLRKKRGKGMLACSTAYFCRSCRCVECRTWQSGYEPERTRGKDYSRCPETGYACITAYVDKGCRCDTCRLHRKEYEQCRRKQNTEYAANVRRWRLLREYGITQDEYERLFDEQDGACKLCGAKPNDGENLSVDHVHDSDPVIVRGLLCHSCNIKLHNGVGPDWFKRAAQYVANDGGVSFGLDD